MTTRPATVLIVGALALAGCAVAEDQGPEPTRVRIGARPFLTNAPLYIALEEGFFEQEGLDVQLRAVPTTSTAFLTAVESGELDALATTASFGLFNIVARGGRLRVVAGKSHLAPDRCSFAAIVGRKGAFAAGGMASPGSLAGRRVDVDRGHAAGFYVSRFLERANLDLDDIDARHLPVAARVEAMRGGSLDAVATVEPWLTRLFADGHRMLAPANELIPGFQWGLLVVGPNLLDDRADAGRRLVRAYLRGVRQYNQGKTPRNMAILAGRTGLDPGTLQRVCWPAVREDGAVDTVGLRAFQEWGLERGLLDEIVPADDYLDDDAPRVAHPGGAIAP